MHISSSAGDFEVKINSVRRERNSLVIIGRLGVWEARTYINPDDFLRILKIIFSPAFLLYFLFFPYYYIKEKNLIKLYILILLILIASININNRIDRNIYSLQIGMNIKEFKDLVEAEDVTEKHFHVNEERIFKVLRLKYYKGKEVKVLYVFFYKNKLYRIDIKYCFECISKEGWEELMNGLFKRYRKPKVNNYYIYGWDDGRTEAIVFRREYLLIYLDNELTDLVNAEEDKIFPFLKEFEKEVEEIIKRAEEREKRKSL